MSSPQYDLPHLSGPNRAVSPLATHIHAVSAKPSEIQLRIRIRPLPDLPDWQMNQIREVIMRFMSHESALLRWLAESVGNSRRFDCDPLEAMQAARLGLPSDLIADLRAISPHVTIAVSADPHDT